MLAVELRPEETRSPLEDLVRAFHFTQFLFKPLNLRSRIRGNTRFHTVVNVRLSHPRPNRLHPVPQLQCHTLSGSTISPQLSPQGPHHPNRGSFLLSRIPPPMFAVFVHDSILVSKV